MSVPACNHYEVGFPKSAGVCSGSTLRMLFCPYADIRPSRIRFGCGYHNPVAGTIPHRRYFPLLACMGQALAASSKEFMADFVFARARWVYRDFVLLLHCAQSCFGVPGCPLAVRISCFGDFARLCHQRRETFAKQPFGLALCEWRLHVGNRTLRKRGLERYCRGSLCSMCILSTLSSAPR